MSSRKKNSRFDISPCWWRPWSDLPQDILCLILLCKKLDLVDRLRFRAVCKSWCIPKDQIMKSSSSSTSGEYPWLFCCLPTPCYGMDEFNHSLRFQLVGPDCRWYEVSKSIEKSSYKSPIFNPLALTYASKFGWRLHGNVQGCAWSLFFHNPFSNDHIVLPTLLCPCDVECEQHSCAATFTASPSSSDCEVLVLFRCGQQDTLSIGRYTYNSLVRNGDEDKSKSWTTKLLEHYYTDPYGVKVHYMDGKLYCILHQGVLKSYSLADETWELVSSKTPFSRWTFERLSSIWLTQIGSSLTMVCGPDIIQPQILLQKHVGWMVFKFDWQQRLWIDMAKDLRNIAFFIFKETIISLPLEDEDDCLIFHPNIVMDCYSFKQRRRIYPRPYPGLYCTTDFHNFGFVEPPFLM